MATKTGKTFDRAQSFIVSRRVCLRWHAHGSLLSLTNYSTIQGVELARSNCFLCCIGQWYFTDDTGK